VAATVLALGALTLGMMVVVDFCNDDFGYLGLASPLAMACPTTRYTPSMKSYWLLSIRLMTDENGNDITSDFIALTA